MSKSPQLENGYTRLANELLDAFLCAGLTGRQWTVLMAIIRKTYGFNKKSDDIGLSQLSSMTGIAKAHVSVVVRELESRRIITRRQGSFGHLIGVNKNFIIWSRVTDSVTVPESVTVTESVVWGYGIGNEGVTESVTTPVTESVTTKDNHPKDNQKTTPKDTIASPAMRDRFARFYAEYPRKSSRKSAEKAFAKLAPDEQKLAEIMIGLRRAVKSEQWRDPKFIPYPATWLNAEGWMDELQSEYTATERAVIQAFNDELGEQLGTIDELIFCPARAGAIRDFLTLSEKTDFHIVYFSWIAQKCELPPSVGFDWLMERETFTRIKGGQFERKGKK